MAILLAYPDLESAESAGQANEFNNASEALEAQQAQSAESAFNDPLIVTLSALFYFEVTQTRTSARKMTSRRSPASRYRKTRVSRKSFRMVLSE